jgi:hypothetical protein
MIIWSQEKWISTTRRKFNAAEHHSMATVTWAALRTSPAFIPILLLYANKLFLQFFSTSCAEIMATCAPTPFPGITVNTTVASPFSLHIRTPLVGTQLASKKPSCLSKRASILILNTSLLVTLRVSLALIALRHCLLTSLCLTLPLRTPPRPLSSRPLSPPISVSVPSLPSSLPFPSRLPAPILVPLVPRLGLWRTQTDRSLLEGVGYDRFGKSSPWCEEGIGGV